MLVTGVVIHYWTDSCSSAGYRECDRHDEDDPAHQGPVTKADTNSQEQVRPDLLHVVQWDGSSQFNY